MTLSTHPLRQWHWHGTHADGRAARGVIHADGEAAARHLLRRQRITVLRLAAGRRHGQTTRVRATDATGLVRRLATLLGAGVPLSNALATLSRSAHSRGMTQLAKAIASHVATGHGLADALAHTSRQFTATECQLVAAGELGGHVPATLARLAEQREHVRQLRDKLQRALAYPLTVLVIALAIVAALLQWVIPAFERLFAGFGGGGTPLPPLTRAIIDLSRAAMAHGPILLASILAIALILMIATRRSARLRRWRDRLWLRLPWGGSILRETAAARWARTLGTLIGAGVTLPDAMDAGVHACGNLAMQAAARAVHHAVNQGQSIANALEAEPLWPAVLAQMAAVGEESGTLGRMLNQAADLLDEEAAHALVTICATLEPMMITLLGLLIGGMVLAMYLPMFQLGYGAA